MFRVLSVPIEVNLFLTTRCNLKCIHCFAPALKGERSERELTFAEWTTVLRELGNMGVIKVGFSGGELFMRRDALEILRVASECSFVSRTVATNGTLIDNAVARSLSGVRLSGISVSVDGMEQTHDAIRGRSGSFRAALRGLGYLLDNGLSPSVTCVVMKRNYRDVRGLVELVYSLGVRSISLNNVVPQGRAIPLYASLRLNNEERKGLQVELSQIRNEYSDLVFGQCATSYYDCLPIRAPENGTPLAVLGCGAGSKHCAITATGWVVPCSSLPSFRGGNILRGALRDIWQNSRAFREIRNLTEVTMEEIPFCRDCQYNSICNAGCRGNSFNVYGDLLMPDPDCPRWEDRDREV